MGQNIVKRFFVRLLATIGAIVLLAAIIGAVCVPHREKVHPVQGDSRSRSRKTPRRIRPG